MKCSECKLHESGYLWNYCHLASNEYYYEYYETPCPFIDDNYVIITDCPELGLTKGEKAV